MPPTKKQKTQNNSGPAANKETTKDTKLQELLTDKSWKETIQCLKTETGKDDAEGPRFLRLALKQGAPINVIRLLLEARPKEACQVDEKGRFPLHAIISGTSYMCQSWSLAVEALLDAYPKAAQQCDENGFFPLHHACARQTSSKVIEKMLNLYPDGTNQAAIYRVGFSKMRYVSLKGWLPIHVACCRRSNLDVIKMLANANPQALQKQTSLADVSGLGLGHQGSPLAYYHYMEPKKFESLIPFQWSFKTALFHHGGYRKFSENAKSVLVFLLVMTYLNICLVEQERFYEQKARRRRNLSERGTNKNTYSDNSFLLLHYALFCGAPLDVIKTISEKKSILLERNKDDELPIHCALDTSNVSAAIHLVKRRTYTDMGQLVPFPCTEKDREGRWPLHLALIKCSPYDDRRNRLLRLMYDPNHESAGMHLKNYLLRMTMIPDADPQQGCGGAATICPLIVREFMHGCPSAVGTPLRCQQMRSGYELLMAKDEEGVLLYPFQILCLLFGDMIISNINFPCSRDAKNAFWEARNLSHTNSNLMRQTLSKKDSKSGQDRLNRDTVVVDVLFKMLQLCPAAIASE